MYMSGIADEAGVSIEKQIRAHRELGWNHIEIRNVNGKNLIDIDNNEFNQIAEKLDEAEMQVCCFASQIANWARRISGSFDLDLEELKRAIPRMQRLHTKYIRIMSYPNDNWNGDDWRKEIMRRLMELARIAEDGGVVLAHENCSGWGGMDPEGALDIMETVDSPNLRFLFDTGNRPGEGTPGGKGTPWDVYQKVKSYIVHVHIKDYRNKGGSQRVFLGEGICRVEEIIKNLLSLGYRGGFSIEPHMVPIVPLSKEPADPEVAYHLYLEYGRKAQALVEKAKKEQNYR